MTTCVLIHNPTSRGSLDAKTIGAVVDALRRGGWDVTVAITERAGHATEIALDAAARGIDVALVHGGDGTINEAISGLAHSKTALAPLRGGTANVWAREIGISKKPMEAVHALLGGERRLIDLGRANGRYFLLMAGVGFDATIVPVVSPVWKRRIGAAAYIFSGVRAIIRSPRWRVRVVTDGEAVDTDLFWMLAANTRSYGGIANITHRATVDDGLLDVAIMHRGGVWRIIVDGVRVLLRRHEGSGNVEYRKVKSVSVETAGIPVQLDGEAFGETPIAFEAVAGALYVVVPRGLKSPLFSGSG